MYGLFRIQNIYGKEYNDLDVPKKEQFSLLGFMSRVAEPTNTTFDNDKIRSRKGEEYLHLVLLTKSNI